MTLGVDVLPGRQHSGRCGMRMAVHRHLLADGERHMEPVTSRPMLLGIVGRIVTSGRKRFMHLTSTHAASGEIRHALERIGVFLGRISPTAPQSG